ncbi:MAG: 4Fe-4S binding protein [bacterium]|nr:4Fe-4S binding protein [bacterium]
MKRQVIKINEELCDGCGQCVPSCAEGAIQIVNGKAKLVKDQYCDGLGACLGECPLGALSIEEREAEEFDLVETNKWLEKIGRETTAGHQQVEATPACGCESGGQESAPSPHQTQGGCPGSKIREMKPSSNSSSHTTHTSELTHWPVQLKLVPPTAPFLRNADLLVAADCAPFAMPNFHEKLLRGRALVIACPKLDDSELYVAKLTEMIRINNFRSITVAHLEVPCCYGLLQIVEKAIKKAGVKVPIMSVNIGIEGEIK